MFQHRTNKMHRQFLFTTRRRGRYPTIHQTVWILFSIILFLWAGDGDQCTALHKKNKNEILVQAFQIEYKPRQYSFRSKLPHQFVSPSISKSARRLYEHPFGAADPPLSTLIRIPEHFVLASTPEDFIPLEEGQRLVCVGDVHGDYQALVDFLMLAGVLEFDLNKNSVNGHEGCYQDEYSALSTITMPIWTGRNTILVQCGDVLDKGSEELACYQLLAQLSHQAESQGGRVVCLYGNHEILNAVGHFTYAESDAEYETVVGKLVDDQLDKYFQKKPSTSRQANHFQQRHQSLNNGRGKETNFNSWRSQYVGNQPARWAAYEPNGLLARSLMANMKVAIQVGRTVCVHAGLTAEQLQENGGIAGLNYQARAYILGDTLRNRVAYNNHGYYASPLQPLIDAERRQWTYVNSIPKFFGVGIDVSSPVWMRDYSSPADGPPRNIMASSMIKKTLQEIGDCDRMVMGHTIQSKINAALDGRAWRVDVGASRGVLAGTPEVLEVCNVNGMEEVSVLTKYGKVPGAERHVMAMARFF